MKELMGIFKNKKEKQSLFFFLYIFLGLCVGFSVVGCLIEFPNFLNFFMLPLIDLLRVSLLGFFLKKKLYAWNC